MKTLGYPEVISYIRGRISKGDMIERISRLTRNYAKRQMTWFRRERDVTWFRSDDRDVSEDILNLMRGSKGG